MRLFRSAATQDRLVAMESVGAQADLRFSVLHWYEMTLSVGYAVGFQRMHRRGDEVMVSLKIL